MTYTDLYKQQAAEQALDLVENGMVLGLGSGSTANSFLRRLAARLADGRLRRIVGVPSSETTTTIAHQLGIPLTTLDEHPELDLAIDGADEIDGQLDALKGLGGALLREKIVGAAARRFVLIADSSKRVSQLGTRAVVPVEIIPFGAAPCARRLAALGATVTPRQRRDGTRFVTDEGHMIFDCAFGPIADAHALSNAIWAIPGVVEHGLFLGMAEIAIFAGPDGIEILRRKREAPG
jgi:ribose 5-phosphate isomerase A